MMTGLFDPTRPKTPGAKPAWEGDPGLPIAGLYVEAIAMSDLYAPLQVVQVSVMLPYLDGHAWQTMQVEVENLGKMMLEWIAGPEDALRKWWGVEPPARKSSTGSKSPVQIVDANPEDFGI